MCTKDIQDEMGVPMEVSQADQTDSSHENLIAMASCPDANDIEMPTQKMDTDPEFNKTSSKLNMVVIETTSGKMVKW